MSDPKRKRSLPGGWNILNVKIDNVTAEACDACVGNRKFFIARDRLSDGWFIWNSDAPGLVLWRHQRFMTRADAIQALEEHYAK